VIGEEHVTRTWRQNCWKKAEVLMITASAILWWVHCVRLRVGNRQPRRDDAEEVRKSRNVVIVFLLKVRYLSLNPGHRSSA